MSVYLRRIPQEGDSNKQAYSRKDLRRRAQDRFNLILQRFRGEFAVIQQGLPPPAPLSAYQELQEISPSLQGDIEYLMRSPACNETDDVRYSLQLRMEPGYEGTWQPKLVILCGTESLRSYLAAELLAFSNVLHATSLGPPTFGLFRYAATKEIDQMTVRSKVKYFKSILGSTSYIQDPLSADDTGWLVTIGGIIMLDDCAYGLTTGHYKHYNSQPRQTDEQGWKGEIHPEILDGRVWYQAFGFDKIAHGGSDWALVELHRLSSIANRIYLDPQTDDDSSATACLIDGTMSREQFAMHLGDENEARCLIASHQGFIPGLVRADIIAMVLNGGTVEVLSLYLEHTLPLGSSGSWVVVDNRLLGTIVATQNDGGLSRAFAIPIESTFNSIRVLTGARKVCLPSTVETKIFDIRSSPPALGASGTVATSDSLKLEILYAIRKAERSDSSPTLFRRNALGTGWAGIRREEVLRIAPGFADSIIDASLKARTYERLTGLKMNTVRSIIKLGHIFPARSNFRIHFRRWVTANKTSHIHGAPAIAARVILEECVCTEAGENILGLICMLKLLLSKTDLTKDEKKRPWLNRHSREQGYAAWVRNLLVAILKALEFPSTEIPSEPQLQAFALNCLLGFKEVPGMKPDSENSQREANVLGYLGSRLLVELPEIPPEAYLPVEEDTTHDQLLEAEFVSRMLLNLSDHVRGSRENVLICSGNPWAGLLADCLGLSIAVRMQKSKDFYAEFPHPKRPDVCLFTSINMSAAVCEVIKRPSELLSAPTSFVESCNPRLSRRSSELPKSASKGKSRERYG